MELYKADHALASSSLATPDQSVDVCWFPCRHLPCWSCAPERDSKAWGGRGLLHHAFRSIQDIQITCMLKLDDGTNNKVTVTVASSCWYNALWEQDVYISSVVQNQFKGQSFSCKGSGTCMGVIQWTMTNPLNLLSAFLVVLEILHRNMRHLIDDSVPRGIQWNVVETVHPCPDHSESGLCYGDFPMAFTDRAGNSLVPHMLLLLDLVGGWIIPMVFKGNQLLRILKCKHVFL